MILGGFWSHFGSPNGSKSRANMEVEIEGDFGRLWEAQMEPNEDLGRIWGAFRGHFGVIL